MGSESLEAAITRAGSAVELLRQSTARPHAFPVAPEFTNWRTEQNAWRTSCVLFDQSHHMTDLFLSGQDALKLLSRFGVNSFANFGTGKAKQYVAVNADGQFIGDAILFRLEDELFDVVGHPTVANWLQYNAETGNYRVTVERDDNSVDRPPGTPPKLYRYELQGPTAAAIVAKMTGEPVPDVKFFNMTDFRIAGHRVRALRHGMAGQPGFELFGPWAEGDAVKAAIVEAGRDFGLRQVGARAYSSNTLESGWIPSPLPAVYTGDAMRAYREWLPANSYEAIGSLGGSLSSSRIEDYYLTPYELGYGPFVKFDHDFIGRAALEKIAGKPHRKKVTFAWNSDDVMKVFRSLFEKGQDPYKYIDLPLSNYTSASYDKILANGKAAGFSMFAGYSYNERSMLSLGVVDPDIEIGNEVTLVWGEEGGGTKQTTVERHKQIEIRAIVSPVPYSEVARKSYAAGWRTGQH